METSPLLSAAQTRRPFRALLSLPLLIGAVFAATRTIAAPRRLIRRSPARYRAAEARRAGPDAASAPAAAAADSKDGEPYELDIDLASHASVRKFLARRGVDPDGARDALTDWLPLSVRLRVWPSRVRAHVGEAALGGYVGFSLQLKDSVAGTASPDLVTYTVVLELRTGALVAVLPTNGGLSFDALKPLDPTHLLLGGNVNSTEKGRTYSWAWHDGDEARALATLGRGRLANSHDVQWSRKTGSYWVPANHDGVYEVDAHSGATLAEYFNFTPRLNHEADQATWSGPNHLTIVDDADEAAANDADAAAGLAADDGARGARRTAAPPPPRYAYINYRSVNAFVKLDLTTSRVVWIAGGHHGTLTLVSRDGTRYAPGTPEYSNLNHGVASLWSGAHNAEWFGEDRFWLFDNAFNMGVAKVTGEDKFTQRVSRVVEVVVDEAAATATEVWSWAIGPLGTHAYAYGDADRLPTGNVVTCDWPFTQDAATPYSWRALEVERASYEPAWELVVADDASLWRNRSTGGWYGYSVERWYTAPLVWDARCAGGEDGGATRLSWRAASQFKEHFTAPGRYVARDGATGEVVAAAGFSFAAHWLPVALDVRLERANATSYTIEVTNEFDVTSTQTVTCGGA